jgi:hypothetical protein
MGGHRAQHDLLHILTTTVIPTNPRATLSWSKGSRGEAEGPPHLFALLLVLVRPAKRSQG